MELVFFQVTDFRSVNDSGPVDVGTQTVLVGRNESGKSSLLRVLHGLNPAGSLPEFTLARDFPRDRPRKDFNPGLTVVRTRWSLSDDDRARLAQVWPRAATVTAVKVARPYKASRQVEFEGVADPGIHAERTDAAFKDLSKQIKTASTKAGAVADTVTGPMQTLKTALDSQPATNAWADAVIAAVSSLRTVLAAAAVPETISIGKHLEVIETAAQSIKNDAVQFEAARKWVIANMPRFVYLDDWEVIPGHHEIPGYLKRVAEKTMEPADILFAKLLKVAELDAAELQKLMAQNHEERKLLTNRAGRVVTKTLRALWKDRQISVEFSVDGDHFDVLVSDADTNAPVPLDERSRGFRWYFSFFICFAADTQGGDKTNAILLLDEPGLFLHATAQSSLLRFFDTLPNRIIYSTHSPFMIDPGRLGNVRTVNLLEGQGTTVTGDPTGDANTLFPLQAALGYDLTQTLFVGTKNVVVEGVTDYWYLTAASGHLAEISRRALARDLVLTPAGGAPKVSYMVALLTAQNLSVVALLDSEPQAEQSAKELQRAKLIRAESIVFVGDAFGVLPVGGADIEDLLEPDAYVGLVEEAYKKELAGRKLPLNANIPRIVQRVAEALKQFGIEFHKTRPAKLFVRKMADAPASVLGAAAIERFERLFDALNGAVAKIGRAGRGPFN